MLLLELSHLAGPGEAAGRSYWIKQPVEANHDFRPQVHRTFGVRNSSGAAVSSDLWFAADKLAGLRPNHYFLLQTRTYLFCRNVKIEIRLQPKPKLRRCAEITGKTESCLSRYATLPQDNFINPPWRHTNVERQAVLAQRHWFQKTSSVTKRNVHSSSPAARTTLPPESSLENRSDTRWTQQKRKGATANHNPLV